MTSRHIHLHTGRFGPVLLGPEMRALEIARTAMDVGLEAFVHADVPCPTERDGVKLRPLREFRPAGIHPGDRILLSESVAARIPFLLSRRGVPFDVDLYGFPPGELPAVYRGWSPSASRLDRIRRALRIQFAAAHAEHVYLSHPGQMAMLAGMLAASPLPNAPALMEGLAEQVVYLPMGTPTFGALGENPYANLPGNRPVFLFGGGIWPWFDLPCLLEAFALAGERGSAATLFFLSGRERGGQDDPVRNAKERAASLGIAGRNVFFNERDAGPDVLPNYVGHCRAGAMANPDSLESRLSWRTRYLDLLAAGRPLVLAGEDPLGARMAQGGAAFLTPSGDPVALADSICRLAADDALAMRMGEASRDLHASLRWKNTLEPLRALLSSPPSARRSHRPGWHWLVRYAISPALARWA